MKMYFGRLKIRRTTPAARLDAHRRGHNDMPEPEVLRHVRAFLDKLDPPVRGWLRRERERKNTL